MMGSGGLFEDRHEIPDVNLCHHREEAEVVKNLVSRTGRRIRHSGRIPGISHQDLHTADVLAHTAATKCDIDRMNPIDMNNRQRPGTLGMDTDSTIVAKLEDGA